MSTTVEKVILDARALLDEYTDDGVVISEQDVADITAKGIRFVDMAQKELFRTGNIYKTKKIFQKPLINQLGLLSNFNIVEHFEIDQYYPPTGGVIAKTYYFECDSDFTVIIEEYESGVWQTLLTIADSISEITAYRGQINPTTPNNLIRFNFSGSYYYKHQNRALFNVNVPFGKEPIYRPWVPYEMPNDFRMVDVVIEEYPERQYTQNTKYKFEGFKTLYVNYYYEGEIRVIYKPVPITITSTSQILEIDDITANAVTYYVASKIAPFENKELVNFFEGKFNELKAESFIKMPSSEQAILDFYGGNNGNV